MKKNKKNETVIDKAESYDSKFWIVSMFVMIALGLAAIAISALSVLRVQDASNPFSWVVVFFFCLAVAIIAYSSSRIFGTWGMMLRRLRLMEERFKGAMSVSAINAYEERENKRKADMEDVIAERMGDIRQTINTNMQKYKSDIGEMYKQSNKELKDLKTILKNKDSIHFREMEAAAEERKKDAALIANLVALLKDGDTDSEKLNKIVAEVNVSDAKENSTKGTTNSIDYKEETEEVNSNDSDENAETDADADTVNGEDDNSFSDSQSPSEEKEDNTDDYSQEENNSDENVTDAGLDKEGVVIRQFTPEEDYEGTFDTF